MINNIDSQKIKSYLISKGIVFSEANGELITHCVFNNCDADSKGKEAHLYINAINGTCYCHKCGTAGNLITICKALGDNPKQFFNVEAIPKPKPKQKLDHYTIERFTQEMPDRIRQYLNNRGINNEVIRDYNIGYGLLYGRYWITFPIKDQSGKYSFLKLKRDPDDKSNPDKGKCFPIGLEAQIYDWKTLKEAKDFVVLAEGEPDRLLLLAHGVPAVTSTNGATTFKEEWIPYFSHLNKVYVCYDNDEAGKKGAERVCAMLYKAGIKVYQIILPDEVGNHGDVTDALVRLKTPMEELFTKYAHEYPPRKVIDISEFTPMSSDQLLQILGLTIKHDEENKLITFLGQLSAFTENSQLNISFSAPSSSGKSYLPMEIKAYFPEEDVIAVAHCTPTAFFHEQGKYDAQTNQIVLDLSRKILIFLDQPDYKLLSNLRPLLSKDAKEILFKMTDKNQRGGNRTKNVKMIGFPSVIFCTTGVNYDEQESTRMMVLSPETSQEKLREGINVVIARESDWKLYKEELESNTERQKLQLRIQAIRDEHIEYVRLGINAETIKNLFDARHKILKPRHQRDIKKILSLAKCLALLNCWWREKNEGTITATEDDVTMAFKIWDGISESQELDLSPYIYKVFKEIIKPLWLEKNATISVDNPPQGIQKKEIMKRYYITYGRPITDFNLRQVIFPALENAGLIYLDQDLTGNIKDKRLKFVYVTDPQDTTSESTPEIEISFDDLISQAEAEPKSKGPLEINFN